MQSIDTIKSYLERIHNEMEEFSIKTFGKSRIALAVRFTSFNEIHKEKIQTSDQHYATLSRNVTQCQKTTKEFDSKNPKGNQILQKKLLQQLNKCQKQIQKIKSLKTFTKGKASEMDLENHLEFLQLLFVRTKISLNIKKQIDSSLEDNFQSERRNILQKTVLSPNMKRRYLDEQNVRANSASTVRNSQLRLNETNKSPKRIQNLIHEQVEGEDSKKSSEESSQKGEKKPQYKQKSQKNPQSTKNSPKYEKVVQNPQQVSKLQSENKFLKQQNHNLKNQLQQLRSHQQKQTEDTSLSQSMEELVSMKRDFEAKSKACEKLFTENTYLRALMEHYETAFSQFSAQFTTKPLNPPK